MAVFGSPQPAGWDGLRRARSRCAPDWDDSAFETEWIIDNGAYLHDGGSINSD